MPILLATAIVCLGLAHLIGHALTSRVLTLLATIIGGAVLLVLLLT